MCHSGSEGEEMMAEFPKSLAESLVLALGSLSNVVRGDSASIPGKDGKPGYSYRYADLGDVLTAVRPQLAVQGLALTQGVTNDGRQVSVTTTILHWAGESMTTEPLTLPGAGTPQAVGSAISYARRYQLMAVLGLASDDDDGQQAAHTPYVEPRQAPAVVQEDPSTTEAMALYGRVRALSPDSKKLYVEWKAEEPRKVTIKDLAADAPWRAVLDQVLTDLEVAAST